MCPIISELLRSVHANNKNGIFTCLAQLKNDPLRCKDFIMDYGGLPILVKLLRSQNMSILNMSLSILADACMTSEGRNKVRNSNIQNNVILILKNTKLEAKMHCRACRLVGNLSECSWHAQSLYNAGVVEPLVTFLQLKMNRQIHLMAVRAIRNIWSICDGSRDKFLKTNAIRLVTQLFVMAKKKCDMETKYTALVEVCLRTMCVFLDKLKPSCGEQMASDKDKEVYEYLIRCCVEGNKMAILCLYGLCHISPCRLTLGIFGAIEQLIYLIKSAANGIDSELSKEMLDSLCLFCRESVHRAKINDCGGLQLFMMLLKKPEFEKYHSLVLHALVLFMYCDNSMAILVKHGLLEVLVQQVKKINTYIGFKSKRGQLYQVQYDGLGCKLCERSGRIERGGIDKLRQYDYDSSPGSTFPSPPRIPLFRCYDPTAELDDIGDDDYSPVYSETEWADNDEETQDEEADSLKSCKSLTVQVDNSRDPEKLIKGTVCDYTTLLLLYKLSLLPKLIDGMADPATIKPLLTFIKHTKNLEVITILIRIVRNSAYFMPLLKQGFVFEVLNLNNGELCKELRDMAETGGAFGQLSSVLSRGEEQLKVIAAVSIPFLIVNSFSTLKCLMYIQGGVQLVFRLLNEPSHKLYERAIWSICRLAITLRIYPERIDRSTVTSNDNGNVLRDNSQSYDNNHQEPSPTVTFELDDGTTVEACRRTLCQRSDAFSAMLEGNFCESGKQRVRLKKTSRDGLSTLILAATGAAYEHRSLESLLDAVLLADKFLMSDLSDTLTCICVDKLSYENFSRAWRWAKINACDEFRSCCVKSFLSTAMTRNEMVRAFRDFSATEAFDEFLCDVQEIIISALNQPEPFTCVRYNSILYSDMTYERQVWPRKSVAISRISVSNPVAAGSSSDR